MKLPQLTKKHSKHIFRIAPISILTCLILTGCGPKEDPTDALTAPRMTMDLPVSLSGIVTATPTNSKSGIQSTRVLQAAEAVTDPALCEQYFDPEADFMENGYGMTRFLVGLSQSQSCFADFIMNAVVTNGTTWINEGLITLPLNADDPDGPTHVQIEQSGDTAQVWLYFATPEVALPADLSSVQTLYLTWTGTTPDTNGQYYMVNMPVNPDDPDAPAGVRVDFTRTASTAENKIYLKMRDNHTGGLGGFRIDVSRTGVDTNASYTAKGLITFLSNPFPGTPTGTAIPNFAASAVVDSDGLGASIASFNNFAISLAFDNDSNGTIDPTINEFDLGSYQFTISDTTYFDPTQYNSTITTTPFADQIIEWRDKSISNANYIADHPRIMDAAGNMVTCMESDGICGDDGDGIVESDQGEWQGWGLPTGYLTDTCAYNVTGNCNDFMNAFFSQDTFGSSFPNSPIADIPTDTRATQLTSLVQLDSVHPDDDSTGATTFDVPDAPVR